MSLLMQALKKAERAKQNSAPEDGMEKPSEAFDDILLLAPQDGAPARPSADSLSLTPLGESAPVALELAPHPAEPVAEPARQPDRAATGQTGDGAPPRQEAPPGRTGTGWTEAHARGSMPRPKAPTKAPPKRQAMTLDPGTIRLVALCSMVLLIVCGYGYWYWQASNAPGAGSNLPMVPMPPLTAGNSAPNPMLVGPSPAEPVAPTPAPADNQEQIRREQMEQVIAAAVAAAQKAAPQAAAPAPAPVETLPPVVAAETGEIKVVHGNPAPQVNPGLQNAYLAFNSGDTAAARQQYEGVLREEPNNRDALLGLAAIAVRENQGAQAASHYLRLLELDPNDAEALSGLIGLRQGDPAQSETRLKAILQRAPDAGPVLFALGNLYAKQSRWSDAQQLFFRAYTSTPGNADYAFNLAVGLDRMNQGKLALTYYQRALALAQNNPGNFSRDAIHKRMRELSANR
ncbi:tetratricopeptide (TPR) repeat protein [Oxalobacteraceae bacterium GrIS 1.11]